MSTKRPSPPLAEAVKVPRHECMQDLSAWPQVRHHPRPPGSSIQRCRHPNVIGPASAAALVPFDADKNRRVRHGAATCCIQTSGGNVCVSSRATGYAILMCVCVRLPGVEPRCTFGIEGRDTPQPQVVCRPVCGTALGAKKVSKTMHLLKTKKGRNPPSRTRAMPITTQAEGRLSNKFIADIIITISRCS
jgi:hypothetical protein